jgi:porphobilinogen synthase
VNKTLASPRLAEQRQEAPGSGVFPTVRPRRLRSGERLRTMVRETTLACTDFIYPLFVAEGSTVDQPVGAMPGVSQWTLGSLPREAEAIAALGIPGVLLFGLPAAKDAIGSGAWAEEGIVQQAIRSIKRAVPELLVVADLCLCEYTSHGHCGVLHEGEVANDETLDLLARTAVSQAAAGADIIAPSDMMDGRVGAIRRALDAAGFVNTPIMSYAVKYASGFYGPFREAAQSAPQFGDRRGYQMDPANAREALREVAQDLAEGADMLIVKPALSYLDIISRVRAAVPVPVVAYNVSGEYAMVKAAAAKGWIDERRVVTEILTSIKRAGADIIISYHAKDMARDLTS